MNQSLIAVVALVALVAPATAVVAFAESAPAAAGCLVMTKEYRDPVESAFSTPAYVLCGVNAAVDVDALMVSACVDGCGFASEFVAFPELGYMVSPTVHSPSGVRVVPVEQFALIP